MKRQIISEISRKGQLLIPKFYRTQAGIKPGSKVALSAEPNRLHVHVLPEDVVEAACGILKGKPSLAKQLRKERHAETQREKKKFRS